jgi:polyhydroxyalkanoate synthase
VPDASLEALLAVSKRVDDGIPFPGQAFRQWIRDCYQRNKLVQGDLTLQGLRIELAKITCLVLTIAGTHDVITPISQAEPLPHLVGSEDKALLVLDAGHVGLMASSAAQAEFWPQLRDWLVPRSR